MSFPPSRERLTLLVATLTLVAASRCAPAWPVPSPQLVNQDEDQLAFYRNVKSYVDRSSAELAATIPELNGLRPVANNEQAEKACLTILDRVGENVQQFYAKFPNTTSVEHVTMERLGPDGRLASWRDESFRYMAVAGAEKGLSTLMEYRTDMAGRPAQPTGLAQGLAITKGFASVPVYFHPALRSDAFFRYLGKQKLDGKNTDVIVFAQRPGWTEVPFRVSMQGRTASLLIQGIAWIDSHNYQIVRMRTDLLAPRPDVGLLGETTVITFTEVRFPEMPRTILWLPREVTVTTRWEGNVYTDTSLNLAGTGARTAVTSARRERRTYLNIHRYSDYKLFGSKSKLKY